MNSIREHTGGSFIKSNMYETLRWLLHPTGIGVAVTSGPLVFWSSACTRWSRARPPYGHR